MDAPPTKRGKWSTREGGREGESEADLCYLLLLVLLCCTEISRKEEEGGE